MSERSPERIPWLWGLNGATSVLGSGLATLVAMHGGISASIWLGFGAYGGALLVASGRDAVAGPSA